MTKGRPSNAAASVRQKLLNLIRETGEDANLVWTRYATERLLYRLSVSSYGGDFVLKGAMLFTAWTGQSYRPTVDMDLLWEGEESGAGLGEVFGEVCDVEAGSDGLTFSSGSIRVAPIREEQKYQGQRVTLTAFLGKARIPVQVDVGFGDVVTPKAKEIDYPSLLQFPAARIRAYPRETVVAEKVQAMVMLGIANTRMKDFCDVYVLARDFDFQGSRLARAIRATFKRRRTEIPSESPSALSEAFGRGDGKSLQWKAFVRKSGLEGGMPEFAEVISHLRVFLLAPLGAARGQARLGEIWQEGGPWRSSGGSLGKRATDW